MKILPLSISDAHDRRYSWVWSWGWHILGLAIGFSLSALTAWNTVEFHAVLGWPMVALTAVAYLAAAVVVTRLRGFPEASHLWVVFSSVTLAYLAVIAVLAFGRLYYSRSYLLAGYVVCLFWLLFAYLLRLKLVVQRFAVIPGGISEGLLDLPGVQWFLLTDCKSSSAADGVVVDLHQKLSPAWMRYIADCNLQRMPVYHSAVVYEAATGRVSLPHLSEGVLDRFEVAPYYAVLKRLGDIALVLLGLPLVLPLVGLVALAVCIDSSGSVIFSQERMGHGGVPFRMYKFRSMRVDAEHEGAKFAVSGDARVTRVGRFIRKCRLDELPQFWNVLKGDMSLIGPRPEQVDFASTFQEKIPYYGYRHLVRPGITGWAQVNQGYVADARGTHDKLEFDLYYIKYLSFWLDFLVVIKTLRTVLTGFGAR